MGRRDVVEELWCSSHVGHCNGDVQDSAGALRSLLENNLSQVIPSTFLEYVDIEKMPSRTISLISPPNCSQEGGSEPGRQLIRRTSHLSANEGFNVDV